MTQMNIILATDGSPHAEYAARMLSHLPHREPIELTVLTTVFIPQSGPSAASDTWLPAFKEEQYGTAREHFAHISEMFSGADVKLSHRIAEGHVGHSITEAAEAIDADLIVLGAKGHSTVNRVLLGSVSDFVASEAKCSVMVVRPRLGESSEKIRVTLAHDNSTESNVALEQFSTFEWGSSVDGHVLCVVPIIRTFRRDLVPDMVFERAKQRDEAKLAADAAARKLHPVAPNIRGEVIEAEHVGESIIDFTQQHQSNLIVVGEHHRSPLGRLMLGSVSRYVMRHAQCSVWIARSKPA
jgi:nucleotide-binding universal stress UspA family protein